MSFGAGDVGEAEAFVVESVSRDAASALLENFIVAKTG